MSNKRGRLVKYDGQSHNGPNEGIPVDAQGNPASLSKRAPVALVEDKEFVWTPDGSNNPYIFSDKLGFANVADKVSSRYKKRLGDSLDGLDSISRKSMNRELNGLKVAQDKVRAEKNVSNDPSGLPKHKFGDFIKDKYRDFEDTKFGAGATDFAKMGINAAGIGQSLFTGKDLIDESQFNTKFGKKFAGASEDAIPVKRAIAGTALNAFVPGAGTALTTASSATANGIAQNEAMDQYENNMEAFTTLQNNNQELQSELSKNPIQSSAIYENGGSLPKYREGSTLPNIDRVSAPTDFGFSSVFDNKPYMGNIASDVNMMNPNSNLNNAVAGTNRPSGTMLDANMNASLIGAGSEIVGGTIGAIQANRRAKRLEKLKGKYDLDDFTPDKISLAEERRDITDRGRTASASARNKARRMGLTQSQYLAAATASDLGIDRNVTSAIEGSKLNERKINLDETQRVRRLNSRNRMINNQTNQRFDMLAEQARSERDQNIQDMFGTIIPGTTQDINAYNRDDRKIRATSKRTGYNLNQDYLLNYYGQ